MRQVTALVGPVTVTYALEGASTLVPLWAAVRYFGENTTVAQQVGAYGLANTVYTCVALILRSGWTGAQDTLVSQAYGKGDFALARTNLHRCQIWMTFLAAVCTGILLCVESLVLHLGVADMDTAFLVKQYVFAHLPGLWFEFQYDTLRKCLLNQRFPTPSLMVLIVTVPAHALICHILMTSGSLDIMHCLGLAGAAKSVLSFLLLSAYVSLRKPCPSFDGWWWPWTSAAFSYTGLMNYARIGVMSTGLMVVDWLAWELLTILAGGLHDGAELAAHVAGSGASEWLFMLVRGAPKAATVLVGGAAGRGDVIGVRAAARACGLFSAVFGGTTALLLWLNRRWVVAWILPGEGPEQACLAHLWPLVVLQLLLNAANSLLTGVFAGLGWQDRAAMGIFLCSWVVQLPIAWFLAYGAGLGVFGLRAGVCIAGSLLFIYNVVVLHLSLASASFGEQIPVFEYKTLGQPVECISSISKTKDA